MAKLTLTALAICGASLACATGGFSPAQAADYGSGETYAYGSGHAYGPGEDIYCDCPAFAMLHRPFYCKHHLAYLPHNPGQPYLVRVYYTPATQPYYNEPRSFEYIPYFGPPR